MIVLVNEEQFSKLQFHTVNGKEYPIVTVDSNFFSGTIIDCHGELYYENGEYTGHLNYAERVIH